MRVDARARVAVVPAPATRRGGERRADARRGRRAVTRSTTRRDATDDGDGVDVARRIPSAALAVVGVLASVGLACEPSGAYDESVRARDIRRARANGLSKT